MKSNFKKGDKVYYIPNHIKGINHLEVEKGIVAEDQLRSDQNSIFVLYENDLNTKQTYIQDLIKRLD